MESLYAPWRSEYFAKKVDGCVFCYAAKNITKDEELGILFRDKNSFGVMNLYPYSPGHFMVIPNRHIDAIENLTNDEWLEMSSHVQKGVKLLKDTLGVKGVNIGMNLGACAGAGIESHVHYHLVPRWERDTNFITTIGNIRVNGVSFETMYKKLKDAYKGYLD